MVPLDDISLQVGTMYKETQPLVVLTVKVWIVLFIFFCIFSRTVCCRARLYPKVGIASVLLRIVMSLLKYRSVTWGQKKILLGGQLMYLCPQMGSSDQVCADRTHHIAYSQKCCYKTCWCITKITDWVLRLQ